MNTRLRSRSSIDRKKKESIRDVVGVINDQGWRRGVLLAIDGMNSGLKGFGIIGGVLLASLADWVLGAITLQYFFTTGVPFGSWIIPPEAIAWAISFAAWGIQLLIWDVIISGSYSVASKLFLIVGVLFFVVPDTIVDSTSIYFLTAGANPMKDIMPPSVFSMLFYSALIIIIMLTGGAEFYIANALKAFRIPTKEEEEPRSFLYPPSSVNSVRPLRANPRSIAPQTDEEL